MPGLTGQSSKLRPLGRSRTASDYWTPACARVTAGECAKNVPILFLTVFRRGLLSPSSGLDERGERDRHGRGAGCGGRQRWGVARCRDEIRLRAGRTLARPATGSGPAHLRRIEARPRPTDDLVGGVWRSASVTDPFALGVQGRLRVVDPGTAARRTPRAERWASLGIPESPDASLAEYRIGIRHPRVLGTRRSARPLSGGPVGMRTTRARKRGENAKVRVDGMDLISGDDGAV